MIKKTLVTILILCTFMCMPITSLAECRSWYIKRNGTNPPTPPADIEMIKECGGFYLNDHLGDGEKKLYLTFDAGYENGNIESIMPKVKPDTNAAEILAMLG